MFYSDYGFLKARTKIASSATHPYGTRSNQRRQMEQLQAELAEMRTQMDAKMA